MSKLNIPTSDINPACPVCHQTGARQFPVNALSDQVRAHLPPDLDLGGEVCEDCVDKAIAAESRHFDPHTTNRAEQLSDRAVERIGSWGFVILLASGVGGWLLLNLIGMIQVESIPLFSLVILSTTLGSLAALQGSIILMSQRRRAQHDRLESENDFRVNLKAELEIRTLDQKLDHLLDLHHDLLESYQKQADDLGELRGQIKDG